MTSYTNIFGGSTVYTSNPTYRAVALTANTTLDWPLESAPTGNVVADIMDVTPASAGLTIRMPPANEAGVGATALFFNVGADAFTVADNGGNTIVSLAAGEAWQVYLTSNTTVNGTWRANQYGAGTSIATAGSLVGAGVKAIGTTLNQAMSSTTLNANYTTDAADRSEVFNWVGGAGSFSLPSSAVTGADWFVHLRNSGTGGWTVQTTVGGQSINGAATLILNPGDSCILFCDGSNFFTIGLGRSAAFAFDFVSIDLTGQPTPYILSGANLNRIAYRFSGTLTNNVQIVVPSTVQQYWVANETDLASAPYTIEIKTLAGLGVTLSRNQRSILYSDGTNVIDADTAGVSLPLSISQGGTGATTESGARINIGGTAVGIGVFTAGSASSARSTLGATTIGDAVFTAATSSDALNALFGGTLSVANGGTGVTTLTANRLVRGNGAGAVLASIITDNGTTVSVAGNTSVTGDITATRVIDATTIAASNAGVRIRGKADGSAGILQFTNNSASAEWGVFSVTSAGVGSWIGELREGGSRVWTAATLTNLNQLANGPGYITNVVTALGYTPANRAGDTFTGAVRVTNQIDVDTPGPSTTGGVRIRGTASSSNIAFLQFTNSTASAEWGNLGVGADGRATYNGAGGFAVNGNLIGTNAYRNVTISTVSPSGGSDGDIWLRY